MATYNVTAQTRRVQFTGDGTAGPFAFSFQVNATSQIKVYVDSTVKTLSSHYTVSLNSGTGAGTVSFTSGNFPTSSQIITILGSIPLSRTSVYTSGGQLTSASLEDDFDTNMFVHQQTGEEIDRSLRLAEHDTISGADMTLPVKDTRKGTVLGFNATTGNPEAGPSITSVQSLSAVTASINLLGTSAVVEDLGILGTTAIVEDMGLLATSGNITAMGLLGVSAVVTDMGILGTTAIVEDMGFLATSANVTAMGVLGTSANVTAMGKLGNDATVADMAILATDAIVADMAILANTTIVDDLAILATSDIVTDMALLATTAVIEDMGLLATSAVIEDMGLLATSAVIEDMGLLATSAVIEDMGLLGVAGVIEDMGILGTSANVTAMSNVSGAIANVNTVASNVSGVNSFAQRYRVQSGVPSSDNDVGDLVFDTSANTLKVFGSSGFQNAGSSVNGTSARFHYDIGSAVTSVTGNDASGNALAYDAGFIDVYVNGVRMSTADVTVTSGDTVTFTEALSASDEVDIVCFGTFSLANFSASNLSSGTIASARISGSYTGITGTGALNAGSITSGFGTINNGASAITTTGVGTFGSLDISGDIDVDGTTNLDVVDIDGAVDMASTLAVAGVVTANAGVKVDNITIDGTEIDLSSGNLTIDVAGDLIIDVDGNDVVFKNGGTTWLDISDDNGSDVHIESKIQDGDIYFRGNDGGSIVNALYLDMSDAGTAVFNNRIRASLASDGTPSYSFGNDTHTGMFSPGNDNIAFSSGGTEVLRITAGRRITTYNCTNSQGSLNLVGEGGLGNRAVSFSHQTNTSEIGYIGTTASATQYNTSSDYRLKESITYDFDATARLKQLKPCRFNFIIDADTTVDGFIAHEVSSIVPEAISGTKDAMTTEVLYVEGDELPDGVSIGDVKEASVPNYQGIDQSKLVPLLTKALQEQQATIEALTARIVTLEKA